ncbi:MAG: Asp-tRNA(Asn)/Glu-tRNA(Gln) amidotransferase GatCAB subunit C [Flavobacteriales bacterium]|nr:Asp-tRNA(Asn)/Glu-tRNA(Gln) amidotransferase GatCAB subunit C [Flavobacteriales bacterium]|tara:strand:- start:5916 stop:6206 length:291 start_codon:yes stop_codon:yes gene_type:complete
MKIDQKLIEKIAKLSQLNLNKEAKIKMEKDLNKILDFVDKLNNLNTDNVEPLVYINEEVNKLRKDDFVNHLEKENALKNAADKDSDYFKVPRVVKK